MLANMRYPEFPVALGVIRSVTAPTYDDNMTNQINQVKKSAKIKNMTDLLYTGNTWEIK
jgi:2-oxoglutarate ferredoxin oxidoreductase subunit beta